MMMISLRLSGVACAHVTSETSLQWKLKWEKEKPKQTSKRWETLNTHEHTHRAWKLWDMHLLLPELPLVRKVWVIEFSFGSRFKNKLKRISFRVLFSSRERREKRKVHDVDTCWEIKPEHSRLVVCQLSIREVRTQFSGSLTLGVPRALNFNFVSSCVWNFATNWWTTASDRASGYKNIMFPSSGTKMPVNCLCQWKRTINKCKAFEFLWK